MRRVFIAEKPSLARAIAQGLGGGSRKDGYIDCGADAVTWCFGHLLELADAADYDAAFGPWRKDTLPIVPDRFEYLPRRKYAGKGKPPKPDPEIVKQVKAIGALVKKAERVVHAGDPDREGQMIVDEVLDYLGNTKPVDRLWLAAVDEASVKKALAGLRSNTDYATLYEAAKARSQADWTMGINATRAATLAARDLGHQGIYSVGRVQTPTLALVVKREIEIENFKPTDYFVPLVHAEAGGGAFRARWLAPEDAPGLDSEGRLVDAKAADSIVSEVKASPNGKVLSYEKKAGSSKPPLPHSLAELQREMSKRFKISAQDVLNIAQSLYESGYTSYPRTDSRYLPEDQLAEAPAVLASLARAGIPGADGADAKLRSAAWNDKKVTAHHAIVPTGKSPGALKGREAQVFEAIAQAFIRQFYPPAEFETSTVVLEFAGHRFKASGKVWKKQGWRVLLGRAADKSPGDEDDDQAIPPLARGDKAHASEVEVESKTTTPPKRFTDGTLIGAMERVHQFVENENIRKRLKETAGLGTEATRAATIETLIKRAFITREKKSGTLKPSASGTNLILALPKAVTDPGMTAFWEDKLSEIESGEIAPGEFLKAQSGFVVKLMPILFQMNLKPARGVKTAACPECGATRQRFQARSKKFYWRCTRPASDEKPECPLRMDNDGALGDAIGQGPKVKPDERYKCPECAKPMARREGRKGPFWGCSGYPNCTATCPDKDGEPDFDAPRRR